MKQVILDTCIWINGLLRVNQYAERIIKAIINQKIVVIVSSYGVAEVINVFRRLAREVNVPAIVLERDIWAIWNQPNVIKDFSDDIGKALLYEVRRQKEIELLTKILKIEPKDVPFIVLAYNHKAPLITADERSLWVKREKIKKMTGVNILLSQEWSI